ncbi:hypothetical protein HXX76_016298 [Chlamydomonas incerta]|uniref:Uncharacterized protein n=1 Tax=Chlamydomonas incerta TaxID=51695 RepID=A0A835SAL1_CHLIN|nr:hypothetical protein HXX76_016298 [Chlamydomonas incerta]|eukprot:KAG2422071.1 hypothetical protein HXX76_016298 [Chlamydomonas incerta]
MKRRSLAKNEIFMRDIIEASGKREPYYMIWLAASFGWLGALTNHSDVGIGEEDPEVQYEYEQVDWVELQKELSKKKKKR